MPRTATTDQPIDEAAQRRLDAQRRVLAAKRMLKIRAARETLIDFAEILMPDPDHPDSVDHSQYQPQYFHRALAAALEEVDKGKLKRLIVCMPPRHGKSQLSSRMFPAWFVGRDPYRSVIIGAYNQPFAEDFGKDVRHIMRHPAYKLVFPNCDLRKGEAASDRLRTDQGGMLAFVGRGGSITGRGADLLIIDDPIKGRSEANSEATRKELWSWYTDDVESRMMTDEGSIIIVQTRWHDDDLVGRLTDPTNPCYNEGEATQWKIINIPALAEENDVLEREVGAALWPERFGREYLERKRNKNPKGFSSLYQGHPTPDDGDLITKDMIQLYKPSQLPKNLRYYAGSDHALKLKEENDRTCLLIVGIDPDNVMWAVDCWWKRAPADLQVDAMLDFQDTWNPLIWWSGRDHITGSIGPFLSKRGRERQIWVNLSELPEKGDKVQKAQPIIARMRQGMVKFPESASWLEGAKGEMLKFPQARHDDFVDALGNIGRGIHRQIRAGVAKPKEKPAEIGTIEWVKRNARYWMERTASSKRLGGM